MRALVYDFPNQLKKSIEISNTYKLELTTKINNVLICGLGGSGMGGELIKECIRPLLSVPLEVCHSYTLPKYVNQNTLVIVCSYSGETEETLSALKASKDKNAQIVGITTGGKLKNSLSDKARVIIPGGLAPRAALAYPFVQLLEILSQAKLIDGELKKKVAAYIPTLITEQSNIAKMAEQALDFSASKKIFFYSEDKFKPLLIRACQQINENSKDLAFFNVIPEMNHNEILGWENNPNLYSVIMFRSKLEYPRNTIRMNATKEIIEQNTPVFEISAKGDTFIEQLLYLIHLVDFISLFKAERRQIDADEIKAIDCLKNILSKSL